MRSRCKHQSRLRIDSVQAIACSKWQTSILRAKVWVCAVCTMSSSHIVALSEHGPNIANRQSSKLKGSQSYFFFFFSLNYETCSSNRCMLDLRCPCSRARARAHSIVHSCNTFHFVIISVKSHLFLVSVDGRRERDTIANRIHQKMFCMCVRPLARSRPAIRCTKIATFPLCVCARARHFCLPHDELHTFGKS